MNEAVKTWVNSTIKKSDKFYHKDYPGERFHALGLNGGYMISNCDSSDAMRKQFRLDDPKIFKKAEDFIGVNPFTETSISFSAYLLDSILHAVGYNRRKRSGEAANYPELNWNPFFIFNEGTPAEYIENYQRGFVWTLEQKQSLISTIYRGLEAGRIILHSHDYDRVVNMHEKGYSDFAFKDVVDGKQRLSTVIDFIEDKFTDEWGNYYSDLSEPAKLAFGQYKGFFYGEMSYTCTQEQIAEVFLNNAVSGTPISKEHIAYMQKAKEVLAKQ
jgi:hypothetical protein